MSLPTRYARPPVGRAAITRAAGAAGLMVLAAGCAAATPHPASGPSAKPQAITTRPASTSAPAPAPAASQPAPVATPAAQATGPAATGYAGPHFTTPQAAMAYLAAAYNTDNTTAMHAVTGPQAFTSLQAMRASDTDLEFTSCGPTPRGDYMCSFRYDYSSGHHPRHQTAMVITAPALNPGWYMYRFISGCD